MCLRVRRRQLARKQERVVARAYGGGGYKRTSRLSDKYLEDDQVCTITHE